MRCSSRRRIVTLTAFFIVVANCLVIIDRSSAQTSTDSPTTLSDIRVTVVNEGNSSFSLTPFWFAFHDGSFDTFDVGAAATMSLEMLAEDGIVDGLVDDFTASGPNGDRQGVVGAPQGFGPAPVIEPGETGRSYITLADESTTPYFSFASMIIPSNDSFVGNSNPMAYEVFDGLNGINGGTFTIQLFADDLYDSGTEDNIGMGAAFSTIGGTASDTIGGVIAAAGDLSEFLDTDTPAGTTITELIGANQLVATISVTRVPEPSTGLIAVALAMGLIGLNTARRRRAV